MPTTYQSIVIDAPIAAVWSRFSNFHDFSWASNVITDVEKVGDLDGSVAGARRILNQAFHETLLTIDHDTHTLEYSIDDGPSPVSRDEVSNYYGVVKLGPAADGSGTLVEWSSSWDSTVEDAVAFCHDIYVAILGELEASFR